MNFSSLARSTLTLSRRVFTPRPSQRVRFKSSSTTYSISLSSASVLRLEIAVTSKEVTLRLVETKTETGVAGTKEVKNTVVKAVGSDKESKASNATQAPIASKPASKESPDSVKSEVVECWVDASHTHIAIVIGKRYKIFVLKDGWMTESRHPNWAETVAIELAVEYLAQHGYTGLALIKSDNPRALIAMTGGKVGDPETMESVRRTDRVIKSLKTSNLTIEKVKISSHNDIAPRFSRGTIVDAEGYEELEGDLSIPEALVPFVKVLQCPSAPPHLPDDSPEAILRVAKDSTHNMSQSEVVSAIAPTARSHPALGFLRKVVNFLQRLVIR
ncbi:hypothetical protein FRC11_008519 [Ceratobasidium sp. 423]|nr:hypothetical protein FRC11_008519 [Ceratobasidium sp. 423]